MLTDILTGQLNNQGVATHHILVDGLPCADSRKVQSMMIVKEINKIPTARITFSDGNVAEKDFPLSSGDDLVPGKYLEIQAGSTIVESGLFKGVIVKQSVKFRSNGRSILIVECKDPAFSMTLHRRNKSFDNMKDSEVFEALLAGYDVEYELEETPGVHEQLIQYDTTDWHFLLNRAEVNGLVVIADDGAIRVIPPSLDEKYGAPFTFGRNILDFDAEMDARYQMQRVSASAWDAAGQSVQENQAGNEAAEVAGMPSALELAAAIGNTAVQLQHGGARTPEELQKWAEARLTTTRLAKIRGRIRAPGIHPAKPGQTIQLEGVGRRFSGPSFVSGVRWEFYEGVWTTDLQLGLAPVRESGGEAINNLLPAIRGLQTGVVLQLQDDPLGEDRIKVRLPIVHDEEEGVWARIASLDAGTNRGAFFRPEIGDEVAIGFMHDDPRDAIVLGMLNSSAHPAPMQAKDENHEKGLVTREGIRLLFNDQEQSVTVLTPGGREIKLDDKSKRLSLKDKNGNQIDLSGKGITISSRKDIAIISEKNITLKGVDIEQKANGQLRATGAGGAEVSTKGVAVLKGSLVQIN